MLIQVYTFKLNALKVEIFKLKPFSTGFCLTDKFFEKIVCLENIKILKLTFETPVSNMIKNRSFSPLKEVCYVSFKTKTKSIKLKFFKFSSKILFYST